jgi:hypothetical protein
MKKPKIIREQWSGVGVPAPIAPKPGAAQAAPQHPAIVVNRRPKKQPEAPPQGTPPGADSQPNTNN